MNVKFAINFFPVYTYYLNKHKSNIHNMEVTKNYKGDFCDKTFS